MNEKNRNEIIKYSKKTPLYLSRRKFNSEGVLMELQCSKCKEFKEIKEYSKNKTQIDGLDNKCRICKNL
jgi:hypothetical protein|tara:strand:- start:1891 stop:2097 length:207 start_codon:yes stop_codon:yes gene_type:complete